MVTPYSTLKLPWTAFLNLPLSKNLDSWDDSNLKISRLVAKKKKKKKDADDKLLEFEPLSYFVHF